MFGGLFAYDTMHTIFIGATGYMLEAALDLLPKSKHSQLDAVCAPFAPFRDKITGVAVRRVVQVTRLAYLTAEQKVICLFTIAHALGHRGEILPENIRHEVLTAIASLEIVCFVTRGKRSFTEAEHNFVFEVIGRRFWNSLARVVAYKERRKALEVTRRNIRRPPCKRKRPTVFHAKLPDPDESSDTVDSDARDADVPPHFIKSDKIIPHAFVHLTSQVKLGGTHQFHNTSAAESKHPSCIKFAGTRVRKYNTPNVTEQDMLSFTLEMRLFDELALMVGRHDGSLLC